MCGIAGELRLNGPVEPGTVVRMAAALRHRGPDAQGIWMAPGVALGHRRLSIVDLEGGAQPMEREGVVLVFNGEAYDHAALRAELARRGHPFETQSDTEVVLRSYLEWGDRFVERIHGMFALAIWDGRRRRLVLARDRLGKKPLHYALGEGARWRDRPPDEGPNPGPVRLVFASELKALATHPDLPRQLDPAALAGYLAVEYVAAPRTVWSHVFKLPAGHLAVLDVRGFTLRRYWELPAPDRDPPKISPEDADRALLELLDGAVARRLVADVPVGVFLSGGIDSTTVAALAARHRPGIATFSIGFDEGSFDESGWALLAARALGTTHESARFSSRACLDLLPEMVEVLDEPFADPSVVPTLLLSRFVRQGVKVALAGDGGDELFAGYDPFLAHRPAALVGRLPAAALRLLRAAASRLPASARNMSLEFRLKRFLLGLDAPAALRHQVWIGAFTAAELGEVLHPDLRARARPEELYQEVLAESERGRRAGVEPGSIDAALRFYAARYLSDDILVKVDRASMAVSLEVREPFLDTALVEWAMRLPHGTKLGLRRGKLLLRRATRGLVPEPIRRRNKKGFGIPLAAWIRGPLRPLFEDLFSAGSLVRSGVFEPEPLRALLQRHLSGRADLRKPLWTAACFLLWQRRWDRPAEQVRDLTLQPSRELPADVSGALGAGAP